MHTALKHSLEKLADYEQVHFTCGSFSTVHICCLLFINQSKDAPRSKIVNDMLARKILLFFQS